MKLLVVIVQDEDASRVISALTTGGFSATRLASSGGFLRAGNTTILAGVEDDRVDKAMKLIEKSGSSRKQVAAAPNAGSPEGGILTSFPLEVTVGGATVFVLNVEQFVKL